MRRVSCPCLALAIVIGGLVPPAVAAPDFSASTIAIAPETPLEADLVTFTIRLRNSGPDDAGWVYVAIEWPQMGFLADATGIDGAEVDHEARTITLQQLPLPAGGEHRVVVRILAPRDSGGDTLRLSLRMSHFDSGTNHYDTAATTIDTRVSESGVVLGGLRVNRAAFVVLGVLAFGAILWLVLLALAGGRERSGAGRARGLASGPTAAAAALTVSVGFFVLFASMAWRDYQSLSWPETTCTILGGRLSAQATTRSSTRPASGTSRDDTSYVPVLGLKYAVDGRETYSSGYDTGSRLGVGGLGGRTAELAQWSVGATTPCWYAPSDPLDVVVLKGFGGAYVFALLPVPVFWLGLAAARGALSRR